MKYIWLSILLAFTISIAFTQEKPTKPTENKTYDATLVMKDLEGKPLTYQKETNGPFVNLTLGDMVVNGLNATLPEDQALTGVGKYERFLLIRRVYQNKSFILSEAEKTLVKERIAKLYSPLAIGAAWEALK